MGEVTIKRSVGLDDYINSFSDNRPLIDPNKARLAAKYTMLVEDDVRSRFAPLEGDTERIDTALEWALTSYYSQAVIKVRPVEADTILPANNPKLAGLKLGAALYQEIQILRFLASGSAAGVERSRDALGRYETMLKFVCDKNGVTRAEIENYYRDGIRKLVSDIVDEEAAKRTVPARDVTTMKQVLTDFFLNPNASTYEELAKVYARFGGMGGQGNAESRQAFVSTLGNLNPTIADAIVLFKSASDLVNTNK